MAKKVRGRGSVAIDTVPLPERVVRGVLQRVRNKYVLKLGRRVIELAPGPLMPAKALDKLAGEEVYAAFSSKGALVAIGTWPTPEKPRRIPRWIICYIPVPEMIGPIDGALRRDLVARLRAQEIISPKLAGLVKGSIDAGF